MVNLILSISLSVLLKISPSYQYNPEVLVRRSVELLEVGNFKDAKGYIDLLKYTGKKEEYKILKGILLYSTGEYDSTLFYVDNIKGMGYLKGIALMYVNQDSGTKIIKRIGNDEDRFKLIFYKENPDTINQILSKLRISEKEKEEGKGYAYLKSDSAERAYAVFLKLYKENRNDKFLSDLFAYSLLKLHKWNEIMKFMGSAKYQSPLLNFVIGTALYNLQRYKEAEPYFIKDTVDSRLRPHTLFALSWIYYRLGDYKNTIAFINKFLECYNGELVKYATYRVGRAYLKMGDLRSLEYFNQVYKKYPDSDIADDALFLLGKINYLVEKLNQAKKYFLRLMVDYPECPWISYSANYVGNIYLKLGRFEKAEQYFNIGLQNNPPKSLKDELIYNLEWARYKCGKYGSLIYFYRSFIKKYPNNYRVPELMIALSDFYISARRYTKGIKVLLQFYKKFPNYKNRDEIVLKIFEAYKLMGKNKEGEKFVNEYISQNRTGDKVFQFLGEYYFSQNEIGKAIDFFRKIKGEELKPYALYMIGSAYFNSGLYREAEIALGKIIEDYKYSDYFEKAYLLLAEGYYYEGIEEDFLNFIQSGLTVLSDSGKVDLLLLEARYYCERNNSKALDIYKKAVETAGTDVERVSKILYEEVECARSLGYDAKAQELKEKADILKRR